MNLQNLIQQADIVKYISQYVDLEEKGGEWWGLSPFKNERTPSFSVRASPPFFYDYSSGKGGNLYSFIRAYHHCSGREAVEKIKKFVGYDGEVASAVKLQSTEICKKYNMKSISSRKQTNATKLTKDYMEKYEFRREKLKIWEDEGIGIESMKHFQVMYDAFSNRIVYPIKDIDGNIVNVGGRTTDQDWKEKKLRKYTYFFNWGRMAVLYALYENFPYIEEKKEIIIFEGCKSVLMADTWGVKNCVALLTSHLNPEQMKILATLGYRVVFALDKDVDVRKDKNIQKLMRYVKCELLWDKNDLLGEKDSPVDKGQEVFKEMYSNRVLMKR